MSGPDGPACGRSRNGRHGRDRWRTGWRDARPVPRGGRWARGAAPATCSCRCPSAKPSNFKGSARRLLRELRPERPLIVLVMVLAVISVMFAIVGPKILGNATNVLFEGVIGKQLGAMGLSGVPKDQIVAGLQAQGQTNFADMLASMNVVPGVGVDFGQLAGILSFVAVIYLLSSVFSWGQAYIMAGVTQRTVYRLRRRVDEKLGRLPLAYFDRESRGDILSRVTNDIDNISQTLQQSLTQLITSVLTVIGVLVMMLTISPLLAVISLLAVPASLVVTVLIASRSQQQFAAQWERTGALNGHVEEMHTGHAIVKLFGRQEEAIAEFDERNEALFEASFKRPVHLRDHPAGDDVHLQSQLRRGRGDRRGAGGQRPDVAWATSRRSSSTRASSRSRSSRPPASSTCSRARSPRRNGCSSCSTSARRSRTRWRPRSSRSRPPAG